MAPQKPKRKCESELHLEPKVLIMSEVMHKVLDEGGLISFMERFDNHDEELSR